MKKILNRKTTWMGYIGIGLVAVSYMAKAFGLDVDMESMMAAIAALQGIGLVMAKDGSH